uniref:Retroviral polymerase SH3-like domain-containing protein n=1 Tax=Nicotiana tabacum TaxID=4097 RepID=A0A1S4AD12_TOBAC|nr:PREDICTED: uncharacterized protein LOC107796256 [Nicotiana tabacum]
MFCKYCKKPGHLIEKCYKVHGFFLNFKFTKGRRITANATAEPEFTTAGHNADGSSHSDSSDMSEHTSMIPGLSMDQYNQLLALLQQSHVSDTSPQSNLIASANFAGTLLSGDLLNVASSSSCMLSQTINLTWIIDYEATDHMTSNKNFLTNLTPLPVPSLVSLPNGYKGLSLKKPLDLGKLDSGLYKLVWKRPSQSQLFTDLPFMNNANSSFAVPSSTFTCNSPVSSSIHVSHVSASTCNYSCPSLPNMCIVIPSCNTIEMNKMDVLWHQRLAHVPFVRMKLISGLSQLSSKQPFICNVCPMSRQTRMPFPDSSITTTKPFQLIHIDTCGPFHTTTYSGDKYFLTIVDDYTRATWTHLMGAKSNAFPLIKAFLAMGQVKTKVAPCIFLGYPFAKKGYKLYNLTNKICLISRDVIFHEHYCPFSQSHPTTTPIPSPCIHVSAPSTAYPESSYFSPSPSSSYFFDTANPLSPSSSSPPSITAAPYSSPTSPPSITVTPSSSPTSHSSSISPALISSTPSSSVPSPPLRRSSRDHHLPTYLQDYATSILAWQDVMRKEFEALDANHTWDIVELPKGKKAIGCK